MLFHKLRWCKGGKFPRQQHFSLFQLASCAHIYRKIFLIKCKRENFSSLFEFTVKRSEIVETRLFELQTLCLKVI